MGMSAGGLAIVGSGHQETIDEAKRLWERLDRKNVMIKVPATLKVFPQSKNLLPPVSMSTSR